MDTDPPLTDSDICTRMRELRQDVLLQSGSVRYLEYNLNLAKTGEVLQPKEQIDKLAANLQEMKELLERKKGELASFSVCPVPSCQFHATANSPDRVQLINDLLSDFYPNEISTLTPDLASKSSEKKPLEKSKIKEKPKSNDKNLKNDKNKITEKAKTTKQTEDPNKLKKARPDGFTSPTKHVKKQKVLQNYTIGAAAPGTTNNKFEPLDGKGKCSDEISRKYPKSKLSGEFLKIFAASTDDHREITALLIEKGEQYFALNPVLNRPQKIVIKGLPIKTDIEEIRQDLTSRGFKVIKVAQFTKSKSKMKFPIFMVEIEKFPESPDIFKLETCCYLTIKVDTYNRRPGAVQCYNCNLFNHSSANCHIKTRCLKCGEAHKTGDCPITNKIENPTCINCNQKGHMANSHRCPKFPKIKPKKGDPSENRNPSQINNQTQNSIFVKENLSFANALKGEHQMAPRSDAPSPASSEPEASPALREKKPPTDDRNNTQNHDGETFGFMDAIIKLKRFFTDYPSLLELGRQLKYAKGTARIDVFYRHLISMK
ncbi:nucleic-acid-binding protein from transposon X-element [Trichonephila clavipes]|nr:nucleic-acid-binding protein from transposon X-element [Trichonephila clavipes]